MHTTFFIRKQEEGLRIFARGWELYQRIIERDYMSHTAVIEELRRIVDERATGALSILEAGCGDAHAASRAFAARPGICYTGVDFSQQALDYARANLEGLPWRLNLVEANMLDAVKTVEGPFDVILAGYSLHHFETDKKARLLGGFKKLLASDGVVLIYDMHTREQESREQYLERILADFKAKWTAMSAGQMEEIHDHVRNNDFPESRSEFEELAKNAGYSSIERFHYDEDEFYALYALGG